MVTGAWVQRWLRGTDTMLGQVRTLFLGILLVWPVFGLWGLGDATGPWGGRLGVAGALLVVAWLYLGYRRQHFPAWSWSAEGACICLVAGGSDYGITIGLLFLWVNFRSLYGRLREKALAALVLAVIMGVGVLFFRFEPTDAVPLLLTALIALVVNHVLAQGSSARDRSAAREATLAYAGAGLVASTTRAEAMDVTLDAALRIDRAAGAALIFTVAGRSLNVIAAAGRVGTKTFGWSTELDKLPGEARAALQPGGYVVVGNETAAVVADVLRLPRHSVVVLAPMAAHGDVFGMLVLALDRRPVDDLSSAVTTLADEAALTLDQLLSRWRLSVVVEHSADALMLAGEAGFIRFVNPAAAAMLGCPGDELVGRDIWSMVHEEDVDALRNIVTSHEAPAPQPCRIRGHDDAEWTAVEALIEYVGEHDGSRSILFTARDVSERQRLELELRHAQKLESVGRLAAGIAHEINTPIQFVGDNVRFLDSAFADLGRLRGAYQELVATAEAGGDLAAALQHVEDLAAEIDFDFVMEETPVAIAQTLDGINQVAGIVRAMKAFGHPGSGEKTSADLNEAISNTIVVANNEIRYVADVETDLGELPLVQCHLGDINQVVLNLVVNAAHAIGAADRGRGVIRVRTRIDGDHAVIEVEDNGTGVPPEIADKLFDPFFTTKDVGTGTGQGLALVRTLVTDRHGGTIDFTSDVGVGTVFTVRLPLAGAGSSHPPHELAEAVR
jgi:PAS domain S-box-containing protein